MASHRDDQGYDDWFDEPELPLERRRRRDWGEPESDENDRWVLPEQEAERPRARRRREREPLYVGGRQVTTTQVALIAGSAVAILLAILAAAGAFSSGSKQSTPPATLSTKPVVQTKTTTPVTTTTTPAQPLAQAPTATLKPGDTGDQVVLLQKALTALGYSPGTPDGNYGDGTKQALSAFQTAKGLTADGVLGPATLAALRTALAGTSSSATTTTTTSGAETGTQAPTTTLKPGDTGAQVVLLQQALTSLGYSTNGTDGTYGDATKAAVSSFQTAKNLTADGVVGPQTLLALQQALAGPTG